MVAISIRQYLPRLTCTLADLLGYLLVSTCQNTLNCLSYTVTVTFYGLNTLFTSMNLNELELIVNFLNKKMRNQNEKRFQNEGIWCSILNGRKLVTELLQCNYTHNFIVSSKSESRWQRGRKILLSDTLTHCLIHQKHTNEQNRKGTIKDTQGVTSKDVIHHNILNSSLNISGIDNN